MSVSSVRLRNADLPFSDYVEYAGPPGNDPRGVNAHEVSEGIVRIIEVEGPVVAKRVYDIYPRGCGIKRMGHELKSTVNKAPSHGMRAAGSHVVQVFSFLCWLFPGSFVTSSARV
ncbi:MAG: hypothetical protein A2W28_09500 [Gammaproteobacteria bacterium RBG_16_51_14]|nr:MAG: hypothetical protein A2W28_09500 [Gammaproteobacteria bacterium RBG_16_51_14]